MNNNQIIASISMDLKRIALSYFYKSDETAKTFIKEVLKKLPDVNRKVTESYLLKHLDDLPSKINSKDKLRAAEDSLMYSTIFQNYVLAR